MSGWLDTLVHTQAVGEAPASADELIRDESASTGREAAAAEGWQADPDNAGRLRYWDGARMVPIHSQSSRQAQSTARAEVRVKGGNFEGTAAGLGDICGTAARTGVMCPVSGPNDLRRRAPSHP